METVALGHSQDHGWQRGFSGEWVREGVGVVVNIQGKLWLAYSSEGTRLGPFLTLPRAAAALEGVRSLTRPVTPGSCGAAPRA